MCESLDVTRLPRPRNQVQIVAGQPYPPSRLADKFHVPQHRLIIPILQPQPEPSPCRVLRDADFIHLLLTQWVVLRRVCIPWLGCKLLRRQLLLLGIDCRLQEKGFGWGDATEGHRGDETFTLHGQHEVDVQLGDRHRRQAQARLGSILEVRTHVREVDKGHGDGYGRGDGLENLRPQGAGTGVARGGWVDEWQAVAWQQFAVMPISPWASMAGDCDGGRAGVDDEGVFRAAKFWVFGSPRASQPCANELGPRP